MSASEVGVGRRATVLFPPAGVVEASATTLLSCFSVFRGDRKLRVGGHCVTVDTSTLSSRSVYFSSMFSGGFKEAAESAEVSVDPPDEESFFHVLYYLMTGTMRDLTRDNFAGVVANADFVQSDQLIAYLQQVALAHHKDLFDHPSFKPPQISGDFVQGFFRVAKTANKVRSLFEAANLIGCWVGPEVEQARPVLEQARILFPLPPRKRKAPQNDQHGRSGPVWKRRRDDQVSIEAQRQLDRQQQRVDDEMRRQRVPFDFVNAMLQHPRLLKLFDASEALLALDPILSNDRNHDVLYALGHKKHRAFEQMRTETKQSLNKLVTKLRATESAIGEGDALPSSLPVQANDGTMFPRMPWATVPPDYELEIAQDDVLDHISDEHDAYADSDC